MLADPTADVRGRHEHDDMNKRSWQTDKKAKNIKELLQNAKN